MRVAERIFLGTFTAVEWRVLRHGFSYFGRAIAGMRMDMIVSLMACFAAGGCSDTVRWFGPATDDQTLRIWIQTQSLVYKDPDTFALRIFVKNEGDKPVIVLPGMFRRTYVADAAERAEYVPFPGPPTPPWQGAFSIQSQEERSIELRGMRDRDGIWLLEPGGYTLSVIYDVPKEHARSKALGWGSLESMDGRVWIGKVKSRSMKVRYEPEEIN